MTSTQKTRLGWICLIMIALAVAVALVLFALRENIHLYFTPEQIVKGEAPLHRTIRVGGLVLAGTLKRDGLRAEFQVSDLSKNITIRYQGILPDLFREGQGVIATGTLEESGVFVAREVLAKHDEKYMPPEVADSLKKNAHTKSHP